MPPRTRRLAAIMFTDMVGYTALVQADEAAALAVLERHNRLLRPVFDRFGGREVKTIGDAFLVEFGSALDAVECALAIQTTLRDYNLASPAAGKIRIRIGVHVGDVVESAGDVLGDSVNIASRIQPLAEPEGICLSQQVFDQVQNKISAGLVEMPVAKLKNVRDPVRVYRVVPAWEAAPAAPVRTESAEAGHHLAVLPLANISPDPNDGYFADGLTEELISVLSDVHGLNVIARTSVIPYKTQPKSIAQVGRELGVDTILEGSVRKAGNRLRITLQLIDVPTQGHLWTETYNREVDDVFAVQADVAERTATALRVQLTPAERTMVRERRTNNPAAYELFLRGLAVSHSAQAGDAERLARFDEGIRLFEQATKLDPAFADAFAAWANLLVSIAGDVRPMREMLPRARELAARAIQLDPDSSEAHAALGNIAFQFYHDWPTAETEFRRAIELNPSNLTAHQFFGLCLMALQRFEEAQHEARIAMRLDPAGHHDHFLLWTELRMGRPEAALAAWEGERDRNPGVPGVEVTLGMFYLAAGKRELARACADRPLTGARPDERYDHALLNAMLGRPEEARSVIAESGRGAWPGYLSRTDLAMLHSSIGEREAALDLLEQDYREGEPMLWLYYTGAWFDAIRSDPRFVSLLTAYGLPLTVPPRLTGDEPAPRRPRAAAPRKAPPAASSKLRRPP